MLARTACSRNFCFVELLAFVCLIRGVYWCGQHVRAASWWDTIVVTPSYIQAGRKLHSFPLSLTGTVRTSVTNNKSVTLMGADQLARAKFRRNTL